MTPQEFVQKWGQIGLRERQASQSHFNDLCALLDVENPVHANPAGDWFTFDKENKAANGKQGFADVWRKNCFAWEYKGDRANLDAALEQLTRYSLNLGNPPLLIVSDMETIRIHTNFQNSVSEMREFTLEDLKDPGVRNILRDAFIRPERLRPHLFINKLTEELAAKVAELSKSITKRYPKRKVYHFLMQVIFAMFAEDVGILGDKVFSRLLELRAKDPEKLNASVSDLLTAMKVGGNFGLQSVEWFNGGLFEEIDVPELEPGEIATLLEAAKMDWSEIDPAIFGTLFEQGLTVSERQGWKAHYTDADTILEIVRPVLIAPLESEWNEVVLPGIMDFHSREKRATAKAEATRQYNLKKRVFGTFVEKVRQLKVLDPACGSGNFLYVSMRLLKDFEQILLNVGEEYGIPPVMPFVSPSNILGIEKSLYATELAKVTVWIGDIQWMLKNGYRGARSPVLSEIPSIVCGDALLTDELPHTSRAWPKCSVIVGNPPFAGDKKIRSQMGDSYVHTIRATYPEVPASSDFSSYWLRKALDHLLAGHCKFVGLVNYNGTRQGVNLETYELIYDKATIFFGVTDKEWSHEGASIRICSIGFTKENEPFTPKKMLDGRLVNVIGPDLSAADLKLQIDRRDIVRLKENLKVAFQGPGTVGDFKLSRKVAKEFIEAKNPSGCKNVEVIKRWRNGNSILKREDPKFIIDFDPRSTEHEAQMYEKPFEHVRLKVAPVRKLNRHPWRKANYWKLGNPAYDMRAALKPLWCYIATVRVAKHLVFVRLPSSDFPDSRLCVIASDDPAIFGIMSSRVHWAWFKHFQSLHAGERPTYAQRVVFETFPFPNGMTSKTKREELISQPAYNSVAAAALEFERERETWLNPPGHCSVMDEPDGRAKYYEPITDADRTMLRKRTLTKLYNDRPEWFDELQVSLDRAVLKAYGFPEDCSDRSIVERLAALN